MASCSEQVPVSGVETQMGNIKKTKMVISTKRPQETKSLKSLDTFPCENSPKKIAKISPLNVSNNKKCFKNFTSKLTSAKSIPKITSSKTTSTKIISQKDTANTRRDWEMDKIKKDLNKCQDELREEVEKRGVSSVGRNASEKERGRLLGEIQRLGVSKRRLESALETAQMAVKRMEGEAKTVRETCRNQVASVERSTTLEVKKLLEDLKTKDQMLASLDRNQYSDRSVQLKIVKHKQQQQQQKEQQKQQLQQQKDLQQLQDTLRKEVRNEIKVQTERETKIEIQQTLQKEMKQKLDQQLQQQHQQFKLQLKVQQCNNETTKSNNNNNTTLISTLKTDISKLEAKMESLKDEKKKCLEQVKRVNDEKKRVDNKMETLKDENDKMSHTLSQLQEEVSSLHESMADYSVEGVLKQFEKLKRLSQQQKDTIEHLKNTNLTKIKSRSKIEQRDKKTVKFLLPDSTKPIVNGRVAYKDDMRFLFFEEDEEDEEVEKVENDVLEDKSASYNGKNNIGQDNYSERSNEVKGILSKKRSEADSDYNKLMNDHLLLEKAYSELSEKKDWEMEKESLNLTIIALEGKKDECEMMMRQLVLQVDELRDKNEELEFQVLELEGGQDNVQELEEKHQQLEELHQKNLTLETQVTELSKGIHLLNEEPPNKIQSRMDQGVQCSMEVDKIFVERLKRHEFEANTTTTTSGIEDISSDDEASIDSMPHDNELPILNMIPSFDEANLPQHPQDEPAKFLKIIEKLELRLACSKLKENNLLDKIALLCEEKKRLVVDAFKGEESMVDEYQMIERDLNRIECSVDKNDLLNDISINEESFNDALNLNNADNTKNKETNDEEIDPTEAKKVAAKLRMKMHFEISNDSVMWIEKCLRMDTPTREEYESFNLDYSREHDNAYLQEKVHQLEKECESLRGMVGMDDGVLRELQIKLFDLENSERCLQSSLEKLKTVEKALRMSKDELEEDNDRMRRVLMRTKSSEEAFQSRLDISCSNELQLKKKLEEVSQDLKEMEKKFRKKSAVAEKLEEKVTESNYKFEDQLGEFETVIELFKRRNSNLERLCEDMNRKIMEGEKQGKRMKLQAECMEQQRDTLVNKIHSLEKERSCLVNKLKSAEEKMKTVEMKVVEVEGLRMCLQACEMEKDEYQKRLESQKDVEMIMMGEIELLNERNASLYDQTKKFSPIDSIRSTDSQLQTSSDDFYQEEFSEGYNESSMKISFTLSNLTTPSQDSMGLLCDGDDLNDYDFDETPKHQMRRTKSLNDINIFTSHKITQTTPLHNHLSQGKSMIPINRIYLNPKPFILSQPPSITQHFSF